MIASQLLPKLGKKPPRLDDRTLRFARYVTPAALPPLPQWVQWSQNAKNPWGMMLNDAIGDCTCAAAAHAIQTWTANHGNELTLPDGDVLDLYERVSGYDPHTGGNDNGAVELDVLNEWRKNGIGSTGAPHRIGAFCAVNPRDTREVKEAIYLFGGLYIGIALPLAWQSATDVWAAPHFRFDFGHPAWQPAPGAATPCTSSITTRNTQPALAGANSSRSSGAPSPPTSTRRGPSSAANG